MRTNKEVSLQPSNGSTWGERAKFRAQNRKWLGYSGKIALRIMSAMEDIPGMNQKKLSSLVGVSPQQINKIVKGHENLTLKTIAKFSDILGTELISFPSFKYNYSYNIMFGVGSNGVMVMIINQRTPAYINYEPMEFSYYIPSVELSTIKLNLPQ